MDLPGVQFIDIHISEDDIEGGAIKLVARIQPKWKDIRVKVFTEGTSNKLVGCYQASDKSQMVLVRIYGHKTELLIDRNAELVTMVLLHAADCGPPLYAKFTNGIAYGFVSGVCLDTSTVRDEVIGRCVAQEMVRMHAIHPDNVSLPGATSTLTMDTEPIIFKKLHKWLKLVPTSLEDEAKNEKLQDVLRQCDLQAELDLLEKELVLLDSPVVLCHNDLLPGNIVYDQLKGKVSFIDYEYTAFNYEAYDIAVHFCEFCGNVDPDFSLYPDKPHQMKWLRAFLEYKYEAEGKKASDVTDTDVEKLYVQVNKFSLVSHYHWSVWTLIQAKHSTIDYDFIGYGSEKVGEYLRRKEDFFSLKMP